MAILKTTHLFYTLFLLFFLTSCTSPQAKLAQLYKGSTEKLTLTKAKFIDQAFYNASTTPPQKHTIYIRTPEVSFNPHFLRERRFIITKEYLQTIKTNYSRFLKESLVKEFEKRGYPLDTAISSNTITVTPSLRELNIFGPDDNIGKHLVFEAGNAQLILAFEQNNQPLLILADNRDTRRAFGNIKKPASRASNARDFKILFDLWAKHFVNAYEDILLTPSI